LALIGAALAGIALGFVGVWLALWLPMAIEQEEAAWVAKAQGTTPAASQTVTVQRIYQALVASKLQMTVFVAITMLACLWIVHSAGWTPKSGVLILLAAALVSLALADWRTQLLPDAITQPMLWLGLIIQLHPATRITGIDQAVLGAVIGYLLPWSIGVVKLLMGREGTVGGGDLKLVAVLGAWFGPIPALLSLCFGSLLVVLVYGALLVMGKRRASEPLPFGPWLVAAAMVWILLKV
jgi:leader peptidase (prepilin peptidase)/N-methyltransferase